MCEARRAALIEAKLDRGRRWAEDRFARQVRWSDRLVGALARASVRRRRCEVELFVPSATAEGFPAWYEARAVSNDDHAMLVACPDHHLFRPTEDGRQEVWETTGGSPLASRFFFTIGDTEALVTSPDRSYPIQLAGAAQLVDGTLIGGIRHQFRDEPGGVRALLTVEFPWLIGPAAPALHRWHLACEFSLWLEASAEAQAA